ncbi:hypothetical protein WMF37_40835 [Sorangium sp. So ce291]|uniref:Cap15 family cyclic dinucleotide receptor domain-containing protein n=1 Tax=Sorangium sp. So ce291 TaxID=3133294 RepID=UPI003F5DC6AF
MLHLLDPKKVLPAYALVTTATSVAIFLTIQHIFALNWEVYKIVTLSSTISSILTIVLFSNLVSRTIWNALRWWSKDIYPNLTGAWEGKICPVPDKNNKASEPLVVRASIKHSILVLFIDFHGETFDSVTQSATPIIEKGQHRLHYVYRSDSKIPGRDSYNGTAILRVGTVKTDKGTALSLKGQYSTDRRTIGTIELLQIGTDADHDVAF